jgi:hypothetical protein
MNDFNELARQMIEKEKKPASQDGCFLLSAGLGMLFFVVILPNLDLKSSTDGVYESATEKIDSGKADELTPAETQRIDDLLNWCKECNEPLRKCRHGR